MLELTVGPAECPTTSAYSNNTTSRRLYRPNHNLFPTYNRRPSQPARRRSLGRCLSGRVRSARPEVGERDDRWRRRPQADIACVAGQRDITYFELGRE